uniref:Uncharacterized protein n=1 Tax=Zea mays TaxID=4577 RepID=A0A804UA63_MAIZE
MAVEFLCVAAFLGSGRTSTSPMAISPRSTTAQPRAPSAHSQAAPSLSPMMSARSLLVFLSVPSSLAFNPLAVAPLKSPGRALAFKLTLRCRAARLGSTTWRVSSSPPPPTPLRELPQRAASSSLAPSLPRELSALPSHAELLACSRALLYSALSLSSSLRDLPMLPPQLRL